MILVIKQDEDNKVEVYEVSEDSFKKHELGSADIGQHSCKKEAIELYKLEYETCAHRYNDLYSAAWTNFSYMALFAGGILTFAGNRFVTPLTAFMACLPLLFWWVATFEPLNRYGDRVQADLGLTEKALNELAFSDLRDVGNDAKKGLSHFQEFAKREPAQKPIWRRMVKWFIAILFLGLLSYIAFDIFLGWQLIPLRTSALVAVLLVIVSLALLVGFERESAGGIGVGLAFEQFRRVRFLVRATAFLLLITAICFGVKVGQLYQNGKPLTVTRPHSAEAESQP